MNALSEIIYYHDEVLEELKRTVFHEDELRGYATSMTSKQYDSLVRGSNRATEKRRESAIPQWLGLPVLPTDPYQDGKIFLQSNQFRKTKRSCGHSLMPKSGRNSRLLAFAAN